MLKRGLLSLMSALALGATPAQAGGFTLVYHRVGTGSGLTLGVSQENLQNQVLRLQEQGYTFVVASQGQHCTRCVVVTFDDGYRDVYEQAFPVLKRLGIPATFFVITEKVGTEGFVSWEELKEMQEAGWEIGSHTQNHARLTDLPPAQLQAELQGSMEALKTHLGIEKACIAYPFGVHDRRVRNIARGVYSCAYGMWMGTNTPSSDPLALHRPFSSPWDHTAYLDFKAQSGLDHTLLIALLPLADWQLGPVQGQRDVAVNPFPYTLMGDTEYHLQGVWPQRQHVLRTRVHDFSAQLYLERGTSQYNEFTASYHLDPVSVGLGYSNGGVVLGASVNVLNYGEAYGYVLPQNSEYGFGSELVPLPYLRVKAAYGNKAGWMGGMEYALPITEEEGRPYRINLDYQQEKWLAGGTASFGSFRVKVTSDFQTQVKIKFSALW